MEMVEARSMQLAHIPTALRSKKIMFLTRTILFFTRYPSKNNTAAGTLEPT